MAFGFSAKHSEEIALDNLSQEQFLVIAIEASQKLEWNLSYTSENGFIAYTNFSMSSWSEKITVVIENNVAKIKSECTGNQVTDWGKNKKNIEALISIINETKTSINAEELIQKYEELKPKFAVKEDDTLTKSPLSSKEKFTGFFSIFKPTQGYFVTPILLNLNIAVFLLMVISGVNAFLPSNDSLILWGANFKPVTLAGEWWRLITCCFLHIGIMHLVFNMYALLYIGMLLEPYLGRIRFISAYLLTAVTSSMASLWWHDLIISAGASGAIFGMYGVFLALLSTNIIEKSQRKALLTSILIFVAYNLMNGLKGGIDNAAHVGGLVGGLVIGYAFIPSLKNPNETKLKLSTIAVLSIAILGFSSFIYKTLPNDIGTYDEKMKDFAFMESKALEVYKLPGGAPKDTFLFYIKDRGIYYWNKNIILLDSINKFNIPDEMHKRNNKIRMYCELRLKSFELLYKAVNENTGIYKDSLVSYNNQIKTIMDDLSKH